MGSLDCKIQYLRLVRDGPRDGLGKDYSEMGSVPENIAKFRPCCSPIL